MPFYDWGACPFEGCTYRRWQALQHVTVWNTRNHRQIAFTIKSGEWVRGITGVVVTTRPGISKVLEKMTVGEGPSVAVSPGDLLYTLHYVGEGYDLFWFQGRTYSDQISGDRDPDPPPPGTKIQIISRPQAVWWVKVRNAKGQVGWTDQTDRFTNMDQFAWNRCGSAALETKICASRNPTCIPSAHAIPSAACAREPRVAALNLKGHSEMNGAFCVSGKNRKPYC
jgi:hypothetical protein